jgi:hypothetical protein
VWKLLGVSLPLGVNFAFSGSGYKTLKVPAACQTARVLAEILFEEKGHSGSAHRHAEDQGTLETVVLDMFGAPKAG